MPIASTGLARITVTMLTRRLDVALPDDVAIAQLIPAVLRHANEHFVDDGAAHGGWVVRRADGAALSGAKTLADQGVRDGDVLALVRADTTWPDPEYDDVVDAIAATKRHGQAWDSSATGTAAVASAVTVLLVALIALLRSGQRAESALIAAGMGAIMLGLATIGRRVIGNDRLGLVCASLALPYAFAAGLLAAPALVAPTESSGLAARAMIGCVAVIVAALLGLIGLGQASPPLIAGLGAAITGAVGCALASSVAPVAAASVIVTVFALGAGLVPATAIRLSGLARWEIGGDLDRLTAAVARADDAIIGLWLGGAVVVGVCSTVMAVGGDSWARSLAVVCAGGLGLRARGYASVRQRAAAITGAAAAAAPLLAVLVWTGPHLPAIAGGLAAIGVFAVGLSATGRPAPYLSRAGDIAEVVCTLSMLPLLCGAVGLYARLRGLA